MKYHTRKKAIILLADGTIFHGKAVGGKEGSAFGEVCFNTGDDRAIRKFLQTLLTMAR